MKPVKGKKEHGFRLVEHLVQQLMIERSEKNLTQVAKKSKIPLCVLQRIATGQTTKMYWQTIQKLMNYYNVKIMVNGKTETWR